MRVYKFLRFFICLLLCINVIFTAVPQLVRAQTEPTEQSDSEVVITISGIEQFLEFSEDCRLDSYSDGMTVMLDSDIDLSGVDFQGIPIFSGVLEGNGHEISGLNITASGSVQGFIRYLQPEAVVRELKLSGTIAPGGTHSCVGGFVGVNAGNIVDCSFEGSVSGSDNVGGIAGLNKLSGVIENCTVFGEVHGDHFVGGVAGSNLGVIRACENESMVNTTVEQNMVDLSNITIDSLTGSESAVVSTDIGGVVGTSLGVVRECVNRGTVGYHHIGYNVGGIAGSQSGYITGCKNYGKILARKEAGGIVGQMEPSTTISFEADTMQILEGQLNDLSVLIDESAANAQGAAEEMVSQIGSMQGHVENAQESLEQLLQSTPGGETPDPDSAIAALNTLNSAISAMSGAINNMAQTGENSMSSVNDDLSELSEHMEGIGQTFSSGSQNVGGSVSDVSDNDTEDDISGKVADCINYGYVQADINSGGIVGSMSVENDFDPEDDFQLSGNSSMNYKCEARDVVLRCSNLGTVNAKRQFAGGIAGRMTLGLVNQCINTGKVEADAAQYVGGIVGQSNGYIRSCGAKCELSGAALIGGIAGTGTVVTDCRSMILVSNGVEKIGAILGYAENMEPDNEGILPVSDNYYLPVTEDIGAIDGICYSGIAQMADEQEFFSFEDLPREFRIVTIRFVFEDGSERKAVVARGGSLNVTDIPIVPEKEGYYGCWEEFDSFDISSVYFDRTFTLSYTPHEDVLRSNVMMDDGLPVMLLQGEFVGYNEFVIEADADSPLLAEGETLVEVWSVSLPDSRKDLALRYHLPDGYDTQQLALAVRNEDGQWERRAFITEGSYAVFGLEGSEEAVGFVHVQESYVNEIILAGCLLTAAVILIITALVIKRRKAKDM